MDALKAVREHPWITAITLACAAGGAVLAWELAPADFGPVRRVVGGIVAGLGIAVILVMSRALGAFGADD